MFGLRTFTRLPSIQNGYELDDVFSVVVPIARVNEISNPSLETNTTGYTGGAGTLARTTAQQYHGAYSLIYTPSAVTTDGCYYTYTTTVASRAISCKFLGQAGLSYTFSIATTGAVDLQTLVVTATGRWQWIYFYFAETSATTRRIYWKKNGHASVAPFYVDGVQSEVINAGELVSTYLDGDQQGLVPNQNPVAYYWNGTPHASTSARSGLTRAGGMVMSFKNYGFLLTAIVGLGLATPFNAHTEYARIDGGYDDYTRKPTRQFTLSGQFQGSGDYLDLRAKRGGLAQLLDRDRVGQDQRLLLKRDVIDPCGGMQTSTCQIYAKYQGGLSGNTDNQTAEQAALTFVQYMPMILADGETGAALSPQSSVANANYIIRRSPLGVWSAMGTGGSGGGVIGTQVIAVGLDGKVYAGGDWTSMGGVANTGHIAYWDPITSTWNAMGTGLTGGNAYTIAIAPNGDVYVGGDFTAAGGVANTTRIAKWNGSAWSSVTGASTANGTVNSIAFDSTGNLYIGGDFTNIGGTAANRIAKLVLPSTFTAMGTGAGAPVIKVIVGPNGDVFAGGSFTSMGGVASTGRIARWSTTALAWRALSSGLPTGGGEVVNGLAFGPNALLYLAGQFASAGGVTAANVAIWNGVSFQPMSSGLNYSPSVINTQGSNMINGPQGSILVGGLFDSAGTITLPDSMAFWNGSSFTPLDVDLNGGPIVAGMAYGPDGTLYIGFGGTGTATASSSTMITNPGTARSYPTITLYGPSSGTRRLYSIINTTNGRALYTSLVLNAGEIATFVLTPDNLSFTSTFQGNIADTINPGSNTADFFLSPGANTITLLSASSSVTATLYFRPAYAGLDDVP